jgi:hypothetical protein
MITLRNSTRTRRLAVNTALAAALVAGCAGIGSLALAESGPKGSDKAAKMVAGAEDAVRKSPQDAALRAALGRAYLAAGRFESAADAFGEAAELGDSSASVALSFALAQIGEGRLNDAIATLGQNRDQIPAGDYGLALALAGETSRGVAVLEDALRAGENTPKLRQNLAYAYALDGRWREARMAASQDVPLAQVGDRMSAWAAQARPEDYRVRVASLLGVPVRADIGRPEALALTPGGNVPQLAAAPAEATPVAYGPAPAAGNGAELPALDGTPGAPVQVAAVAEAAPEAAPVPSASSPETATAFSSAFARPTYVSQPVVQSLPARAVTAAAPSQAPARARIQRASITRSSVPALASADCTHLVQLGSFSSEQRARQAWTIYVSRNPELRGYKMTITPAVVKGRNFWRVAASGLDSRRAVGLCSTVRGRGGACFAYASARPWPGTVPALGQGGAMKARRR